MRSLAALTTTAAIALGGVAHAQTAAAPAAAPTTASPVESAVHAYAAFQNDIGDLRSARVSTANELEAAIDVSARHNRQALSRGWIAYGAMTAAQSPAFVQGVREAAAYYGRDAVIQAMTADTGWARMLRGGDDATRIVLNSATADASRIVAVADRYREMAYTLQRQRWANAVAPQQAMRVQRVRALGVTDTTVGAAPNARLYAAPVTYSPWSDPTVYGGRRFWDTLRGGATVTEVSAPISNTWRLKPERGEAVNRMTTLAALEALNAADERPQQAAALLNESRSNACLEMAQLQLYQCMSAARFRYENAFCLSQHALRDIGTCIGAIAAPAPADGASSLPGYASAPQPTRQ